MRHLSLWASLVILVSCNTGLDKQMNAVLDKVEDDLGYVNTLEAKDVEKLVTWFDAHGDASSKARALYCLGRTQMNNGSYSAAIVTDTRALEYAATLEDSYRTGLICLDIAHIHGACGNSSDQIDYLTRAAEAFKKAGRNSESQKALLEIGQTQAANGRTEAAEDIFKSVLFDSHEMKDTLLEAKCLESYASLAVSKEIPDPALAVDLLGRAADELGFPLSCTDKGILAYAYSLTGQAAESQKWLRDARSSAESDGQVAEINFRSYQIAARNGDSKKALESLEKVMDYGNRSQTEGLEEAVATSQRDYIQSQADAQFQKLRSARLRLWVMALAGVLAAGAAWIVWYLHRSEEKKRLEEEKAEREKYMNIAEDLKTRLSKVNKFDTLERLCEQYYIYEGTDNLQPKILKEVKSIVSGLRSDKKVQKELENVLDARMDNVMTRLRTEFPSWKEDSFLLYCFAAAGFSSTTISTLMEKDKSVIYNRIWRLKGRISSSDSTQKEFFLNCLGD